MVLIILHLLIGIISVLGVFIYDMRGSELDLNYFSKETIFASILLILFGLGSPLIVLITLLCNPREKKHWFTKFIYKLSNVGTHNKKEE